MRSQLRPVRRPRLVRSNVFISFGAGTTPQSTKSRASFLITPSSLGLLVIRAGSIGECEGDDRVEATSEGGSVYDDRTVVSDEIATATNGVFPRARFLFSLTLNSSAKRLTLRRYPHLTNNTLSLSLSLTHTHTPASNRA